MDANATVQAYMARLAAGDVAGVTALFVPGAMVHSPLYGDLPAAVFYPRLAEDTRESRLSFRQLFQAQDDPSSWALRFTYHWFLADGSEKVFDCVDVLKLHEDGRIEDLTIIYDTHPRPSGQ